MLAPSLHSPKGYSANTTTKSQRGIQNDAADGILPPLYHASEIASLVSDEDESYATQALSNSSSDEEENEYRSSYSYPYPSNRRHRRNGRERSTRRHHKWELSDFELLSTLGTGSFGRVRLARLIGTDDYFAIKCMKKERLIQKKQEVHVHNEKNILRELSHPFIVKLYGSFQDRDNIYFVQEFVRGGEMFTHLRSAGRFPTKIAKFYHAELVLAFEYLHSLDIIYRDLKPENLLLDSRGHVKITDFGFAKRVPDRTFTLCGTPEYLAPEVIQSKGHGKAVDWWTMGILLYEFIAGYPPFYGDSPLEIYDKVLAGNVRFPKWFSVSGRELVEGLLQVDPAKRVGSSLYGGAQEVKDSRFFHGANWKKLERGEYNAPLKISVSGSGDTTHFEKYRESSPTKSNEKSRIISYEDQKKFIGF